MQKKALILFLATAIFLLSGCAHNKKSVPSLSSDPQAGADVSQNHIATLSDTQTSDIEDKDDFMDDFEEEFQEEAGRIADPIAPWNRAIFHFNDKFYFWVLKPFVKGYRAVMPRPVRAGVRNFFNNITTPARLANCLLQGKGKAAGAEIGRFLVNSTIGVLGFGNPAKKDPLLNPGAEDLGQTLGSYRIGNGFYIVWPFLGPSTLRDSIGMVGDAFLNPGSYIEPTEAAVGIEAYKTVNETSFRIGDYESFKKAAVEPYEALRDAYIQNRKKKVNE